MHNPPEAVQKEYSRALSSGATIAKLCNAVNIVSRKISRYVAIAENKFYRQTQQEEPMLRLCTLLASRREP